MDSSWNFAAPHLKSIAKQLQDRQFLYLAESHPSSWWALRAGVLRRAVSHSARPRLRCATSSVTVGRSEFAPQQRALPAKCFGGSHECCPQLVVIQLQSARRVWPNHTFNRTLRGVPSLGQNSSPNSARRKVPVNFYVRPRNDHYRHAPQCQRP